MNIKLRPAKERGTAEHGWLHARFTFSFANYYHPEHCGFHSLIVMNNDIIEPGGGFPTHPHSDAEIFTYVMSGKLQHQDSIGNGSVIEAGNLQYMSAGDGVMHSEYNPSNDDPTELYQIWMQPNQKGGTPRYAEKILGDESVENESQLLFSGSGKNGSTQIRQKAEFSLARLSKKNDLVLPLERDLPHLWIQVIEGEIDLANHTLTKADGIGIENLDSSLVITAVQTTRFFIFRLAD
jgi:redox-sensitive bicupin YhaK (pirin superfamily)